MAFQVPSVFTAIDKVTAPTRVMSRSVSRFSLISSNSLNRIDRSAIRALRSINRLVGGFGLFLGTAAAFQVLGGAINVVADYEQANANLAAVTQVTTRELNQLKDSSFALGASTKFTATEVAGLQTELGKLGFTVPEILNSTAAVLSLASATNTELAQTATQVGSALRAFQLDASEAGRVADVFAASTSKSALDMTKLDVALSQIAPVANQFGFSIENTVALMGKLADAGFEASTIATSTRSIILNLADSNGKLAKALGQPARTLPEVTKAFGELRDRGIDLASMLNLTDKRSVAAFANFLEGSESINKLSKELDNAGGTAQRMADTQLNTLQGRLAILNSAYQGLLLQQDKNNTGFLASIKLIVEVATEVLSLAGGFAKATDELNRHQRRVRSLANMTIRLLKIVKAIIIVYVTWKALVISTTIAMKAYNIVLLLTVRRTALVRLMTIRLAASWKALNVIMAANPIGLIIAAIAALAVGIHVMTNNWNEWGAAVSLSLGPLGLLISFLQSIEKHWDLVGKSFQRGGFIGAIKAIGLVIVDAFLFPMQQLLEIIKDFTGLDLGVEATRTARNIALRRLDELAGLSPVVGPVTPVAPPPSPLANITLPPPTEPIDLPSLQTQLFGDQQTNVGGKIEISVKDDEGRLNVDASQVSENVDVKVQRGFSFSTEE